MKQKNIIILFILLLTIIFLMPIDINWFSFWMDNNWLLDSKNSIVNYIYWWNPDLFWKVSFTSYTSFFHYIISYFFLNLFWYTYWYYFMYFFIISTILILGYNITNIYIKNNFYSILISALFIFNLPFLRFFYWQGTFTFFIATIWFLLSFLIILKINASNINKYLIILAISSILISHPFLFFFYIIIISILLMFFQKIWFKKFLLFWIGILWINFFWIFQFLIGSIISSSSWLGQKDYSDSLVNIFSMYSQLYNSLLFLWKNSDYIVDFFWWSAIFIFLNMSLFWILFFKITIQNKLNRLSISLLVLLLFLILFSVWWREPLWIVYSYLYNNISFFSFFRTFSNVLLFAFYIFLIFILVNIKQINYKYLWFISMTFILYFIISVNYYSYNKTVKLPDDYFIVKNIIDQNSSWKNVMLLPCSTYDYYSWDTWKQDKYFLESYLNNNWIIFYRPTLSNYEPIKSLFDKVCSYNFKNSDFKNYNIGYILLRKDLKYIEKNYYEYFDESKLKWIQQIYNWEYLSLYKLNFTNYNTEFIYITPIKYKININFKYETEIKNLTNFHPEWKIYLKNQEWLFNKPLFENSHHLVYDYANWWTISKDEIIKYVNENYSKELQKEWYPKTLKNGKIDYKYYTLNSDGSIDVELTLYFKPQSYFYLWLIISGSTFIVLIWYLWYDFIRSRRKKEDKNQTE